jgi:hypothetical protein
MRLQELYGNCNHGHSHEVIKLADKDDDTESLLNGFLKRIHDNTLSPGQIDPEYYKYVSGQLKSGVAKGLGGSHFGAADYKNTLKSYLDQNIYAFSSARSLYMLEQYRNFLTDADGNLLSESAFINKVTQISDVDNINHLKTERSSAIAIAQGAQSWPGLQAFDLLEYRTTGGERVCPICGGLDGLVMASNDPRWFIYIPNHFGCMCIVVPAAGDAVAWPDDTINDRIKAAQIPPYFKRNFAEQQLVFADDHPYIQKVGVDTLKELDAVKNYGLRSGEKIYNGVEDLPDFKPISDKAVADAWWQDMSGSAHGSFELIAADDLTVTFDDKFRHHVLDQNSDDRYRIIKQVEDVLENPDEIWSNRLRGEVQSTYIKYYNGSPVALGVETKNGVRAITIYEVKKGGKINYAALTNIRKGILKYKSH